MGSRNIHINIIITRTLAGGRATHDASKKGAAQRHDDNVPAFPEATVGAKTYSKCNQTKLEWGGGKRAIRKEWANGRSAVRVNDKLATSPQQLHKLTVAIHIIKQ